MRWVARATGQAARPTGARHERLSVAEILDEPVTLELESIDRMYLNVYIPRLQSERGIVGFFRDHRGHTFASSALMPPM